MILKKKLSRFMFASTLALGLNACGGQQQTSKPAVTDVDHTMSKRQSIGNCWLYAAASWLESLAKTKGQELDISESYWTWWHFYNELVGSSADYKEISTGGGWSLSTRIIWYHGYLLEGEFLPNEEGREISYTQEYAEEAINAALAEGGELHDPASRTDANVRKFLDKVFGSDMALAESKARTSIGEGDMAVTVKALLSQWQTTVRFPRVFGQGSVPSDQQRKMQREVFQRVMRALNDKVPVVMTFMVDFNGLKDGVFQGDLLNGTNLGRQGGHMVVLEDYTVRFADGTRLGQGEIGSTSEEIAANKMKALTGELEYLVAKNSWGANRVELGIKDGLTSFDVPYMVNPMPWKKDNNDASRGLDWASSVKTFILPAGY